MSFIVRDLRVDDLKDAEKLAVMFATWDSVWPGGFTRGITPTPEWAMREMQRRRGLFHLVAEQDGEFIGLCAVQAEVNQNELAYVELLGANPASHGKGVGKQLLLETVLRISDSDYLQLTLHTWPGNMKAVPLYKKTGFQWVPESTVYMRNFLPTILNLPAGKAFFQERDWYQTQKRDLTVAPDDVRWNGMKVFVYRFEAEDEFLECIFDADSERLTALSTSDYSVSCSIGTEEGATGEAYPIVWEINPGRSGRLEVNLLAEAEPGLDCSFQVSRVITELTRIEHTVKVSRSAHPRKEGETAHRVRSWLIVNGVPVTLETGLKVVDAIELEVSGQALTVDREEIVRVRLRNHLDRDVTGSLALDAMSFTKILPEAVSVRVPARSWSEQEFTLRCSKPGSQQTRVRFQSETTGAVCPVLFRICEGTQAIVSLDPVAERAYLDTTTLQIELACRGGKLTLRQSGSLKEIVTQRMAELGPPFVSWRLKPLLYEVRIETEPYPALLLSALSKEFPGLLVERRISLASATTVRVDDRVLNVTDGPISAQLKVTAHACLDEYLVFPALSGIKREPLGRWGTFPETDHDMLAQETKPSESWIAAEAGGSVAGVVWTGETSLEMQPRVGLFYDLGEIPAHTALSVPPVYLVAGGGNWETVRDWWRRVDPSSGYPKKKREKIKAGRVLDVRSEPFPAILFADQQTLPIQVMNEREKPLNGELKLSGSPFLAREIELPLIDIRRENVFRSDIEVVVPIAPTAGVIHFDLISSRPEKRELSVVALGGAGETRTEQEGGEFQIDNGYFTLKASSRFAGTLFAIERGGINHLYSAYPHSRPNRFTNPWFGGIAPFLDWPGDARLTQETFSGEQIEVAGASGRKWNGVRMTACCRHKDLTWLKFESEYLVLPGSNVVALRQRWINLTQATQHLTGGLCANLQPGGAFHDVNGWWEQDGRIRESRRGGFPTVDISTNWAAVESGSSGTILGLFSSVAGGHVHLEDLGEEGAHPSISASMDLSPLETCETLHWLVLTEDRTTLEGYRALTEARHLP